MLNLTNTTKLKPEEVIRKADQFFGRDGLGLLKKEEDKDTVYFEGGGGGVRIYTSPDTKGTKVDIETREWELQVKDFVTFLKK